MKSTSLISVLACQKSEEKSFWPLQAGEYSGGICYNYSSTDISPPYEHVGIDCCYTGDITLIHLEDSVYEISFNFKGPKQMQIHMDSLSYGRTVSGFLYNTEVRELWLSDGSLKFKYHKSHSRHSYTEYEVNALK